ncbi:hypothetical protein EDC04DRAFT_2908877 [Pisolithus marmoratus]|nr:hypothetical protein EDC04DRAFT_2908877 [Pisolithus marmoratus]
MLALESLHAVHIDMQTLQEEWAAQVHSQTQPPPCQAKSNGLQRQVDQLEMDLVNDHVNDIMDFELQHTAAKGLLSRATQALHQKKSALGVSAQTDLYLLRNNKWLQTQTSAQALKVQIREHLWQHKFELEHIAGSSRHSANDNHLQSHVESSIKRREPAISHLITTYNTLCDELLGMIQLQKAPSGAIPPLPIPTKGIFQLDLDSDIWQDGHQADEVDHYNEEERRFSREQSALQEWFTVEWQSLQGALENAAEYYKYHLQAHRHTLLAVYVDWEGMV